MKLKYWEMSKLIKLRALAWTSWVKKNGLFAIRLFFRGNSVWNCYWLGDSKTKDSREMYSFQSQDNQICLMHYIILYALWLIPNAGWCHLGALYPHPRHRRHPPRRLHHHGQVSQACGHLESSIFLFPDQWGTDAGKHQVLCRYFNVKCFRLTILESSLLP